MLLQPDQIDISTLAWVKGEIDETLKQARIALETYAEDESDENQLRTCINLIQQVVGTLKMVKLNGAAQYSQECLDLATEIQSGNLDNDEDAYELLMQAILQLPDFLESLLAGEPDDLTPLAGTIGAMREVRKLPPLKIEAVFNPNLKILPPAEFGERDNSIDLSLVLVKVQSYYKAGLLSLIRKKDVQTSLKAMYLVLLRCAKYAQTDTIRQVLWVSLAYMELLQSNPKRITNQQKSVLGELEKILKLV